MTAIFLNSGYIEIDDVPCFIPENEYQNYLSYSKMSGTAYINLKDINHKIRTEKICNELVICCLINLKYVKEQTLLICLKAITQYGNAIEHVINQTEELCIVDVSLDVQLIYNLLGTRQISYVC